MTSPTRSLRVKLTLWYLLVFSAIQVGLVLAVLWFRRDAIQNAFDDRLEQSARAMVENLVNADHDWTPEGIAALLPEDAGFALFAIRDGGGAHLAWWNVDDPTLLPLTDWETVPAGPVGAVITRIKPEPAARLIGKETSIHLITVPFRHPDRGPCYFQAAVSGEEMERSIGPVSDLLFVGLPIGIVAALLSSWLIALRAVAPLRRLSEAAQSVSPAAKRLHVASPDEEVGMLQRELNLALERIEAGYRAQEEFIANVSHELKTPIAILGAEAHVLRHADGSNAEYHRFVDSVEQEMSHLGRLVESLLSLSRLDLGRDLMRVETVGLNDLVLESVRRCTKFARGHGVRLVPQLFDEAERDRDEPRLRGDLELLHTMLDNLVRNAVRFSPSGAAVEIRADRLGERASIAVTDRGAGIPEDYVDRVFDRFVQVADADDTGRASGSGLGLAIARNVALMHGGSIYAKNVRDGGCSFVIRLPEVEPEAENPAREASLSQRSSRAKLR